MTKYNVVVTAAAEKDIVDIYEYIFENDTPASAEYVLDKIKTISYSLEIEPGRGRRVPELVNVGVTNYRQLYFKPYRIIYQIQGSRVFIMAVVDTRRDLQDLLVERLIR
ncbi:MAG: type II toxin-antitoxin system RelE/ParE family toxin [Pseudomonadales bacterium]|nr:type II toxin-antitoxin system RelE/ParE family toxin [Pseudomonadales bacterium]